MKTRLTPEAIAFLDKLRGTIELMNIPQRDVARILGVQQATLSRWLNGKFAPRKAYWNDLLYKLASPSQKEGLRKTPEAYKIDLGIQSLDFRKIKQILRMKRLFVLDPARVTLTIQTLFENDSEKIINWFREED